MWFKREWSVSWPGRQCSHLRFTPWDLMLRHCRCLCVPSMRLSCLLRQDKPRRWEKSQAVESEQAGPCVNLVSSFPFPGVIFSLNLSLIVEWNAITPSKYICLLMGEFWGLSLSPPNPLPKGSMWELFVLSLSYQSFSDFNVLSDSLGTFSKCRFWSKTSGEGPETLHF